LKKSYRKRNQESQKAIGLGVLSLVSTKNSPDRSMYSSTARREMHVGAKKISEKYSRLMINTPRASAAIFLKKLMQDRTSPAKDALAFATNQVSFTRRRPSSFFSG